MNLERARRRAYEKWLLRHFSADVHGVLFVKGTQVTATHLWSAIRSGKSDAEMLTLFPVLDAIHLKAARALWIEHLATQPNAVAVPAELSLEQCRTILKEWRWLRKTDPAQLELTVRGETSRGQIFRLSRYTLTFQFTNFAGDPAAKALRLRSKDFRTGVLFISTWPPPGYRHSLVIRWVDGTIWTLQEPVALNLGVRMPGRRAPL